MVWCRKILPKVGDSIMCRKEGLRPPARVVEILNLAERRGSFYVRLDEGWGRWWVGKCCLVQRELKDE